MSYKRIIFIVIGGFIALLLMNSSIIFYQILSLYRCNPYRAYCNALYPVHECFRDCLSHNIVRAVTVSVD